MLGLPTILGFLLLRLSLDVSISISESITYGIHARSLKFPEMKIILV
jgi:hypothetical protein